MNKIIIEIVDSDIILFQKKVYQLSLNQSCLKYGYIKDGTIFLEELSKILKKYNITNNLLSKIYIIVNASYSRYDINNIKELLTNIFIGKMDICSKKELINNNIVIMNKTYIDDVDKIKNIKRIPDITNTILVGNNMKISQIASSSKNIYYYEDPNLFFIKTILKEYCYFFNYCVK